MSDILEEVIHDILLFLPINSLLRFKCLCKALNTIICSQSFARKRYFRKLVLVESDAFNANGNLHVVDFDNGFEKDTVFENVSPKYHLIDECNGLFALFLSCNKICVWNPSLGQRRILPPPIFPSGPRDLMRLTIGYDSSTDDYKIVALENGNRVWVFSLKSGLWRRALENFPYSVKDPYDLGHGSCFADGVLYFLHIKGTIVAFDLASEKFSVVCRPIKRVVGGNIRLHCFRGCLSIEILRQGNLELYVRKQKGAVDFTWIKLYSVETFNRWRYGKVIGFSMDQNKILMQKNGKLSSYNLEDGVMEQISIEKKNNKKKMIKHKEKKKKKMQIQNVFLCSESFVPIELQEK